MALIGSLVVNVSANASQFAEGMKSAASMASSFAAKLHPANLLKGVQGGLGSLAAPITNFLNPIKSALTSIPFLGSAFAALPTSAGELVSFIKGGMSQIRDMDTQARKLGITTESLAGIMLLAGGNADEMARGLLHLGDHMASAAMGAKDAKNTFGRLGLQDVPGMALDDALVRIADHVAALPAGAQRAHVAFQLFGKTGADLLPILSRGGKAIEEFKDRAAKMGLAFSPEQADQVRRAGMAMKVIETNVTGLQRQLAIQSAPFIEALGQQITSLIPQGFNMAEAVVNAMEIIATVASRTWATVSDTAMIAFNAVKGAMLSVVETILFITTLLTELQAKLPDALGGDIARKALPQLGKWGTAIDEMRRKAAEDVIAGVNNFDFGKANAGQLKAWFDDLRAKAQAAGQAVGGVGVNLGDLNKQWEQLQEGQKLVEELRTPFEKLQTDVGKFQELFAAGAIDPETFVRAMNKAWGEFDKNSLKDIKGPGALAQGSKEAVNAIIGFKRQAETDDPMKRVELLIQQQKDIQEQQLAQQVAIALALDQQAAPNIVNLR